MDPDNEKRSQKVEAPETGLDEDPFAIRTGMHLSWKNVSMVCKLPAKKSGEQNEELKILDHVWGAVPVKQTTAIMGPSGSGKTSLLNVLSGRSASRGKIRISADISVNGVPVKPNDDVHVRTMIAYVEQHDSLMVTSTPREAIRFSAKLRLPKSTPDDKLDILTTRMINELGLQKCADTMVGGKMIKGLSGGERKRTTIGVELVAKPSLVFLDEPTSGLDSAAAVQTCRVLKKVAESGAAVLFTIHQPSSQTFCSFDRLILLNQGRIMYQGPAKEVPDSFAERGFPIPSHYNPADFIMEVTQSSSVQDLEKAGFFAEDIQELPPEVVEENNPLRSSTQKPEQRAKVSFATQLSMLLTREVKNTFRNTNGLKARFGLTTFMSLLIGCIFFKVGATDLNVPLNMQSIFGGLLVSALVSIFTNVLPSLIQFPEERPVFVREYSTNHYSVMAYFISRLVMEAVITGTQVTLSCMITYLMIDFTQSFGLFFLCIYLVAITSTAIAIAIGSAVDDPSVALEFLPALFMPQILFAGFFVNPELIPIWLRWLVYVFPLTYTVRILLIEEFNGKCTPKANAANPCKSLLNAVGANPNDLWWYWVVLVGLFAFFRIFALVVLRQRSRRF